MSPLYNPLFLLKILKSYLIDIDRLKHLSEEQLRRFQDKKLRQMVRFAYTVPMYHDLYKKAQVHSSDIRGINDITKLPLISKNKFRSYSKKQIRSSQTKEHHLLTVATSGTSGKKLTLYVDWFDIIMGLFGYLRVLRTYGINWRKDRISIIGDFQPHTAESGYINRGINTRMTPRFLTKNIQWLDTNDPPPKVNQALNSFQPVFIGGYVGMLGHLALLKEQGKAPHLQPQLIASTGAVLDPSLKEYIKTIFQAPVIEAYGATETGPIAYECPSGLYHVLSDLLYLEYHKDGRPVASHQAGHLITTKLYGGGTPIIRYTAINDVVAPDFAAHPCGLAGEHIHRIYGRDDLALYFPEGKALLPASISTIFSKLLYQLKTNKLKDVKITQNSLTDLTIECLFDPTLRTQPPAPKDILTFIKQEFERKLGAEIEITVREVQQLPKKEARISSTVDPQNIDIKQYM